jgi:glycosyltransferase involved in cell wall biosynthesis
MVRVLMLAEDCNPDWPSLPVVGYKFAKEISKYADVTLVTQIRNQPNLDRDGCGNAELVYIDTEEFAAPLHKLIGLLRGGQQDTGWTFSTGLSYFHSLYYEWKIWQKYRKELKAGKYDIVHRLTPMTPTHPSLMALFSPVPFILGPLNGGLPWPEAFQAELQREREWLSYLRNIYKVLPLIKSTYLKSDAILAAFAHTIADLPKGARSKMINYPEVGIDPGLFSAPVRDSKGRLTILYAGRLVPYKLPEVVVRTFASSPILRQHRLVVVGEGPERERLEAIVAEHHLESCVEIVGRKTQSEVGTLMREADIFAFPSIRELGAGVVIEAMACGMAPVVVDYGGPADLVQPGCGVKVPMGNLDQLVSRFTIELEQLVQDPNQVSAYGQAAHRHAMQYYTWQAKAQQMLEIYEQLMSDRCVMPELLDLPISTARKTPVLAGRS